MNFSIVTTKLNTVLEKVAYITGTLPAVLIAVAFLLFFGIGNPLSGGKLDPGFAISNWIMNGIGFCMFFILAAIANKGAGHQAEAADHAKAAADHAAQAHKYHLATHDMIKDLHERLPGTTRAK